MAKTTPEMVDDMIGRQTIPDDSCIVIERRIVLAEIRPDEYGEHPMLRAAFMAASDAMADYLTNDGHDAIEFVHGPHRFRCTAEPDKAQ